MINAQRFFSNKNPDDHLANASSLIQFKSYNSEVGSPIVTNYLCHPSKSAFGLLQKCEITIRSFAKEFIRCSNPETRILNIIDYNVSDFPECHHLKQAIFKRYIKLRLNVFANDLSHKTCSTKQYASKTAARSCIN